MSPIECFPVSVHLIICNNNTVLMQRRINTGFADGWLSLPSGKLESYESVLDCVIREANEELGIYIKRDDISIVHVLNRKGDDKVRVDYFMWIKFWSGEIQNLERNKCEELVWCNADKLPKDVIPYIVFVLSQIKRNVSFSLYGWVM